VGRLGSSLQSSEPVALEQCPLFLDRDCEKTQTLL
jgi:hypothetical protein